MDRISRSFSQHEVAPFPVSCSDEDRLAATGHANGRQHGPTVPEPEERDDGGVDLLVERARSQLRVGNRKDAYLSLREVINVDPTHPGLQEIEDEFNLELP